MISIGLLEHGEISAVTELWRKAGLAHPWNDSAQDVARALAHPTNRIFVARLDNEYLVGSIMVGFDGHRGWIYSLAVDPGQQGLGIGKKLVECAEAWLRSEGAPVVRLLVEGGNAKVAGFYEACGFERGDFITFGKRLADASSS